MLGPSGATLWLNWWLGYKGNLFPAIGWEQTHHYSRWNTTNSPNFTCTAGSRVHGYFVTQRKTPQHEGGESWALACQANLRNISLYCETETHVRNPTWRCTQWTLLHNQLNYTMPLKRITIEVLKKSEFLWLSPPRGPNIASAIVGPNIRYFGYGRLKPGLKWSSPRWTTLGHFGTWST
jgi:hypothetical protein